METAVGGMARVLKLVPDRAPIPVQEAPEPEKAPDLLSLLPEPLRVKLGGKELEVCPDCKSDDCCLMKLRAKLLK